MGKQKKREFVPPKRECGKCTACCQGTLHAEALGHYFHPGQPCHWVGESGCTVYKDRPEVCSAFKCAWLADDYLPMWFQPQLSNLICTWNKWGDDSNEVRTYLKVHTTDGKQIDSKYLRWLETASINCSILAGSVWPIYLGTDEFKSWIFQGSQFKQLTEST